MMWKVALFYHNRALLNDTMKCEVVSTTAVKIDESAATGTRQRLKTTEGWLLAAKV